MRRSISMRQMIVTALILLTVASVTASALGDTEGKRIEYLIASVENLKGAKFIRNGSEHDGKEAAAHLRMKRKNAASSVRTAEDFINKCASKSYLSGKPYLIVFSNGQTVPSEVFFRQKLREYDQTVR
jgi:hypothetical protein